MKIAIVSTPFIRVPPSGYGGTELFCYEMAEGLTARGYDVTLFTTGDSAVTCRKRALYLHPQWPPMPADEVNHVAWALSEVARDGSYDVVHLNCHLGLPISRFLKVPVVHTVHHCRDESISRIYAVHPEINYVCISERQRELEVPLPRSRVIHHGVRIDRYPTSCADEGYLTHIGRYAEEKGTHIAIDVAKAAGLPIKLAGRTHSPDRAYFEREVAPRLGQPGVDDRGEADHDQKIALLCGARALLCPLQWEEPFGLIAIEAMLCGTPVIGFDRGSFPEIIDEGVTGFLIPPKDAGAMTRAVKALSGFDREACAARARERFSTDVMVSAYESLYRHVLTRTATEHLVAASVRAQGRPHAA